MKDLHPAPVTLFWHWINERHSIYIKRSMGHKRPWTEDVILQQYKFTNVFRQLDKGTVWLTEHFINPSLENEVSLDVIFFNIAWYRLFNWIPTGENVGFQIEYYRRDVSNVLK